MRRRLTLLLIGLLFPISLWAETFTVADIQVDGLKRLDLGRVFRAFEVEVGDSVDEYRLAESTRKLFATGYFNDIQLFRDGDVLIVRVQERPALSKINIKGNSVIETEALLDGLGNLGLREGEVFQRATLERIRLELGQGDVLGHLGRFPDQLVDRPRPAPQHLVSEVPDLHGDEPGNAVQTGLLRQLAAADLATQRLQNLRAKQRRGEQLVVG